MPKVGTPIMGWIVYRRRRTKPTGLARWVRLLSSLRYIDYALSSQSRAKYGELKFLMYFSYFLVTREKRLRVLFIIGRSILEWQTKTKHSFVIHWLSGGKIDRVIGIEI